LLAGAAPASPSALAGDQFPGSIVETLNVVAPLQADEGRLRWFVSEGRLDMKSKLSAALAASLLTGVIGLAPTTAVSAPFDLYVGYADGLRGAGFFPNPWAGSPGVQAFLGQSVSGDDAGAIMIINTSGSPLTINSVGVTINGVAHLCSCLPRATRRLTRRLSSRRPTPAHAGSRYARHVEVSDAVGKDKVSRR
jgi:hypothetical protein